MEKKRKRFLLNGVGEEYQVVGNSVHPLQGAGRGDRGPAAGDGGIRSP